MGADRLVDREPADDTDDVADRLRVFVVPRALGCQGQGDPVEVDHDIVGPGLLSDPRRLPGADMADDDVNHAKPFRPCSARVFRPWQDSQSVWRLPAASVPPSSRGTMWSTWAFLP